MKKNIEKNEKLGKKLFITGKGRCNVTNAADMDILFSNVCTNRKFLYSAFYTFDNTSVMDFIESAGCPLKVERGDRVFPVSDHSSDIISAFQRELKKRNVTILLQTKVASVLTERDETEGKPVVKGKWSQVMLPSGRTGWVLKEDLGRLEERLDIRMGDAAEGKVSQEKMEDIITSAQKLLGVPYLWGGMSAKGVDCSGLVRISCIMNGILIPRNASQQIKCGKPVEVSADPAFWNEEARQDKEAFCREMKQRITSLKRGDLVFFGTPASAEKPMRVTHVGIYLGNGEIIHSSHMVRINSLNPGANNYYENAHRLIGGCRLVN